MVEANKVNIYPFAFAKPGVPVSASDTQKWNFAKQSTDRVDLADYPEGNEMLGAEIYFGGRIYRNEDIVCFAKFFDDDSGQLLWSGQVNVNEPPAVNEYWNWYRVNFWIGHFQWEIFKASTVRTEIDVYQGSSLLKRNVMYMPVLDTRTTTPPGTAYAEKRISLEFRDLTSFNLIHLVAPGLGYVGGGVQKLLEHETILKEKINFELPAGWVLTGLTVQGGKYLHIDLEERGSDPFTITTGLVIIAIVAAALVLLGLLVVAYKITDTVAKKDEYDAVKSNADLAKTLIDMGIDPEVVLQILDGVQTPDDPPGTGLLDEFKDIMIMGVMAVMVIMLIQQMGKRG